MWNIFYRNYQKEFTLLIGKQVFRSFKLYSECVYYPYVAGSIIQKQN